MASREERRVDILKAAVKVFSQNGLHKAKVEDIAKEAGIGKGTIYEYFDSKKDLFQEMIKYSIESYKNGVEQIFQGASSVMEGLLQYANFHGSFLNEHLDMAQTLAAQSETLSEDMRCWIIKTKLDMYVLMEAMIKKGIATGELNSNLDIDVAILSIIGTINQYYAKKIFVDKENSNHIDPAAVIEVILNGIGKTITIN